VKRRKPVWRGCPEDNGMQYFCSAYNENGQRCGAPATHVDNERGCYVCDKHKRLFNLTVEATGFKP